MSKKRAIPFLLSGVVGAIAMMILGLSMGWFVTSGRALASATDMSSQAVKDQLVPICQHQFNAQADQAGKLEGLRKMKEWERGPFIEEKGWATMPGSESSVAGVAVQCARRLVESAS